MSTKRVDRDVRICLFDILGTVVDDEGTVHKETAHGLSDAGLEPGYVDAILAGYPSRLGDLMKEVTSGQRPWQRHRQLRLLALRESVAEQQLPALAPEVEQHLAGVIHRLKPWPESAAALRELQHVVTVVGLSNADLAELAGLSRNAGLSWHALLSGELVHAFKPDPAVYEMALELLGASPNEVMMVAAHPWDLRAAAKLGLATAYIARPGAERPSDDDTFDYAVEDLAGLVPLLS